MGPELFRALWTQMAAARATVTTASGAVIATALCVGLEAASESTEQGVIYTAPVTVRFLLADDPPLHGCGIGKVITVTLTTSGQSRRFRITARADIANVVRLTVEAVDR